MTRILLVGAGLTNATIAASLQKVCDVHVWEHRAHIAGNCHDQAGVGTYGPHLYHSPDARITRFLSRFTDWILLRNDRVYSLVDAAGSDAYLPIPLTPATAAEFPGGGEAAIAAVFRGYSQKMWGIPFDELPSCIAGRVPKLRDDRDYFAGQFTAVPKNGYTEMITRMLAGARVQLGVPLMEWWSARRDYALTVYTGRVDMIPGVWRVLPYRNNTFERADALPLLPPSDAHIVNVSSLRHNFLRVTRWGRTGGTGYTIEYPGGVIDHNPTHVFPTYEARQIYQAITDTLPHDIVLAGRLGKYLYLDMYQAVANGIATAATILRKLGQ